MLLYSTLAKAVWCTWEGEKGVDTGCRSEATVKLSQRDWGRLLQNQVTLT